MKQTFVCLTLILLLLFSACQASPTTIPITGETAQPGSATAAATVLPSTTIQSSATAQPSPTDIPATAASSATAGTNSSGGPVDEIVEAMLAAGRQQSLQVDQTITTGSTGAVTSQIEVIPPDRFRMVNPEMEMIVIGSNVWVKVDENGWLKLSNADNAIVNSYIMFGDEVVAQDFKQVVSNAIFQGEEMLEGEQTRVYEYDLPDEENKVSSHTKIWVAKTDGLPRRTEIVITAEDPADSGQIVTIYQKFNESLTIEAPENP